MRSYTIFLFLLLFGLCSSVVDDLGIASTSVEYTTPEAQTAIIQEITNISTTATQDDTGWLYYVTVMTWKMAVILGKTLIYTVTIIPLFVKLGVPIQITAIIQTMQIILIGVGLFQVITQRPLKQAD
jgi:hypothetical protein